jgi:hypothetical protein
MGEARRNNQPSGALDRVGFSRVLVPNVQSAKGRGIPTPLPCAGDNLPGNYNLGSCTVCARSGVDRQF